MYRSLPFGKSENNSLGERVQTALLRRNRRFCCGRRKSWGASTSTILMSTTIRLASPPDLRLDLTTEPDDSSRPVADTCRKLVRPEGFEPTTYSSGGCRSIHLSYGRSEGLPIVWPATPSGNGVIPTRADAQQVRANCSRPTRSSPPTSAVIQPQSASRRRRSRWRRGETTSPPTRTHFPV